MVEVSFGIIHVFSSSKVNFPYQQVLIHFAFLLRASATRSTHRTRRINILRSRGIPIVFCLGSLQCEPCPT